MILFNINNILRTVKLFLVFLSNTKFDLILTICFHIVKWFQVFPPNIGNSI